MDGLPVRVDVSKPQELRRTLEAALEQMRVWQGAGADKRGQILTVRDVLERTRAAQLVAESGGPPGVVGGVDRAPPPQPSGLSAAGAITNVMLAWEFPEYPYLSYFEVWRAGTDNLATATLLGRTLAKVYTDAVGPNATYYYWVRAVSWADVAGPYNATAGTEASTGFILTAHLADLLVTAQKLADASVEATKIANAAVGSAAIANLAVGTAHIQDAAINNAKIANLSVDEAKIVNAAITNAKISDLAVSTIKIQDQAVVIPVSAYTSSDTVDLSGEGTWYTVQSLAIASSGAPITIFATLECRQGGHYAAQNYFEVRVYRGSTTVWFGSTARWTSVGDVVPRSLMSAETPGAGVHTYLLQARGVGGDPSLDSFRVRNRVLVLMETKK